MAKIAKRSTTSIGRDANTAVLEVITRAGQTFDRKVLSSEAKAKDFLLRTGIYTKTGRLSSKYK